MGHKRSHDRRCVCVKFYTAIVCETFRIYFETSRILRDISNFSRNQCVPMSMEGVGQIDSRRGVAPLVGLSRKKSTLSRTPVFFLLKKKNSVLAKYVFNPSHKKMFSLKFRIISVSYKFETAQVRLGFESAPLPHRNPRSLGSGSFLCGVQHSVRIRSQTRNQKSEIRNLSTFFPKKSRIYFAVFAIICARPIIAF